MHLNMEVMFASVSEKGACDYWGWRMMLCSWTVSLKCQRLFSLFLLFEKQNTEIIKKRSYLYLLVDTNSWGKNLNVNSQLSKAPLKRRDFFVCAVLCFAFFFLKKGLKVFKILNLLKRDIRVSKENK